MLRVIPQGNVDQEQTILETECESHHKFNTGHMTQIATLSMDGQMAAICVTHNRVAVVYRRFRKAEKSTAVPGKIFEIEHYFVLLDHALEKLISDVLLPSSIRWLTAIVPYGTKSEYLLCDPASQQLLLYKSIDGILIRRFRVGPVNACCLTDGRLALWIEKPYPSTPIGKLHFISAPHLENESLVAASHELLQKSHH